MKAAFYLFLLLCLAYACSPTTTDRKGLADYLNDPSNGLKKEVQSGSYKMTLTYRPSDFLIEDEPDSIRREDFATLKSNYDQYNYFLLNMSLGDKDMLYSTSNSNEFSSSLSKLNFELKDYVYALTDHNDTLSLADYLVPNLYGMGGSTQILLAFPKAKEKGYTELRIYLNEMGFGMGTQKFVFQKQDLDKIPSLKQL